MTTPLAGITVLDFGQIFQGPYATMLMAKAGADVIKIEPPGGEPLRRRVDRDRRRHHAAHGDAERQQARGDAEPEARARPRTAVARWSQRADVLLENFSPGTMDGLGVGCDVLQDDQPAADLRHRHRLRHQRARPRQPGDGFDHPGRLRHHERHRRSPTGRR